MRQLKDQGEQEENELIEAIQQEMKAIKSTDLIGAPISVIFGLYGRINRVDSLCAFGKKHLKSLTLRGANQIRMVEQDLNQNVERIETTIEGSNEKEIIHLWKTQQKASS